MTERGVLTETPAILAYVAQTHPQANLAPLDDPFAFAELQSFISYLCSTVHVAHAHRARGYRWTDDPAAIEAMKKKVPQSVGACFDLIERKMFRGPWVMGEAYTIADPYLFTIARWLEVDSVDPAAFPACSITATGWPSGPPFSARSRAKDWRDARLRDGGSVLADRPRPAEVKVSHGPLAKLPPYRGRQSSKLESARAFASRLAARRRCIPEGRPDSAGSDWAAQWPGARPRAR